MSVTYQPDALVRTRDICRDPKTGAPGLLPIVRRTWLKWVAEGKAPEAVILGGGLKAWRVCDVLQLAKEPTP